MDEPNDNWEFRSGAGTFGPDTFVIDEHGAITITSPGRDRKDPALQRFRRVRYFKQRTDEDAWIGAASLRRDMIAGRVDAGVPQVRREIHARRSDRPKCRSRPTTSAR